MCSGLTLLPVASGVLAGVAAVSLGFGSVHGVTLGFGATLIGEAVDYAIYLFTNTAPDSPPQAALKRIWPTLRLGVLTSVLGCAAMLFSGFPGLAQLGLFTIAGLVTAAAVTRWVLPELVPRGYSVRAVDALAPVLLRMIARGRALRIPLLVTVLVLAVWLAVQGATPWNDELSGLSPVSMSDQRLDEALRKDLGAPDARHLVVVAGASEQAALETAERVGVVLSGLQSRGVLAGYDSPARYLPSVAAQARPPAGDTGCQTNCAATWPARHKACRFAPEHLRPSLQKRKRQKNSPRWCVRICKARRWR